MSISLKVVSIAAVCWASTSRAAMVWRRRDIRTRSSRRPLSAGAGGAWVEAAGGWVAMAGGAVSAGAGLVGEGTSGGCGARQARQSRWTCWPERACRLRQARHWLWRVRRWPAPPRPAAAGRFPHRGGSPDRRRRWPAPGPGRRPFLPPGGGRRAWRDRHCWRRLGRLAGEWRLVQLTVEAAWAANSDLDAGSASARGSAWAAIQLLPPPQSWRAVRSCRPTRLRLLNSALASSSVVAAGSALDPDSALVDGTLVAPGPVLGPNSALVDGTVLAAGSTVAAG